MPCEEMGREFFTLDDNEGVVVKLNARILKLEETIGTVTTVERENMEERIDDLYVQLENERKVRGTLYRRLNVETNEVHKRIEECETIKEHASVAWNNSLARTVKMEDLADFEESTANMSTLQREAIQRIRKRTENMETSWNEIWKTVAERIATLEDAMNAKKKNGNEDGWVNSLEVWRRVESVDSEVQKSKMMALKNKDEQDQRFRTIVKEVEIIRNELHRVWKTWSTDATKKEEESKLNQEKVWGKINRLEMKIKDLEMEGENV